jgi:hypothetical protein
MTDTIEYPAIAGDVLWERWRSPPKSVSASAVHGTYSNNG